MKTEIIEALAIELTKSKISELKQGTENHKTTAELLIDLYKESIKELEEASKKGRKHQAPATGGRLGLFD